MVVVFELWHSSSQVSFSYFARDDNYERNRALLACDAKFLWQYDAKSYFDAMRAMHEHLDWEEWTPEPDWPDTLYDEGEMDSQASNIP